MLFRSKTIKDYAPSPFRNFRQAGDSKFLKDAMGAKPAPAWKDFVECINNASVFAIITARGHNPSTIRKAIFRYIISGFNGIDTAKVYQNIKKYNQIFKRTRKDASIGGYLDMCKFYPVMHPSIAASADNPEQAKVESLADFIQYCKEINKGMPFKVGFSDDDKKNIEVIKKHFSEPKGLVTIKYTGEPLKEMKLTKTKLKYIIKEELNKLLEGEHDEEDIFFDEPPGRAVSSISPDDLYYHFDVDGDGKVSIDDYVDTIESYQKRPEVLDALKMRRYTDKKIYNADNILDTQRYLNSTHYHRPNCGCKVCNKNNPTTDRLTAGGKTFDIG